MMTAVRSSILILVLGTAVAGAQRPDSVRAAPPPTSASTDSLRPSPTISPVAPDSLRPPISPRRALLYAFIAPGSSQGILKRHKAASAFLLVEAISIAMIRESAADLHEARRFRNDTLVIAYNPDGSALTRADYYTDGLVRSRKAHVEDWIALLVANHLLAGADAFVAANLWDVKAKLALRSTPNGTMVGASIQLR